MSAQLPVTKTIGHTDRQTKADEADHGRWEHAPTTSRTSWMALDAAGEMMPFASVKGAYEPY